MHGTELFTLDDIDQIGGIFVPIGMSDDNVRTFGGIPAAPTRRAVKINSRTRP